MRRRLKLVHNDTPREPLVTDRALVTLSVDDLHRLDRGLALLMQHEGWDNQRRLLQLRIQRTILELAPPEVASS